jgi:pimeloyl-ACP methyl ester carboxylesterase
MWMPGLGNCSRAIGLMSDLGVGSGKPALVLLHPFLLSGNVWQDVVPLLSSYHQVFTPTLLGHRGGPPVQRRPVTIWDVIDAAEQYLNEHGLQRPHLVGNSAGGFVALELARRGRAATVCALSPAGFWSTADGSKSRADNKVHRIATMCRLAISVGPLIFKSATEGLTWVGLLKVDCREVCSSAEASAERL